MIKGNENAPIKKTNKIGVRGRFVSGQIYIDAHILINLYDFSLTELGITNYGFEKLFPVDE